MHAPSTRRAGFTLIELLAVIAILGLLMSLAVPLISKARATANQNACAQQLRQIASVLQVWVDQRNGGRYPKDQGPKFLLVLLRDGEISLKEADTLFRCPGTNDSTRSADNEKDEASGIKDFNNVDYTCISYAGRDGKSFPVNKNKSGEEVIASDDNDGHANHPHQTNIVFADAHLGVVDIKDFATELLPDAEYVPVGPESPSPDLKKLLKD